MIPTADQPDIRPARAEDAPALARFMSLFDNESVSAAQAAERLQKLDGIETALLARKNANIVGVACLRVTQGLFGSAPQAEVVEFFVENEHRDGDTERQLLHGLEALARQRGASQITLLTGLKNADAQAIYRASGYQAYAMGMRKMLSK
jgi:N-acetylglutamate synthase-like GNAT family acetyltransferase